MLRKKWKDYKEENKKSKKMIMLYFSNAYMKFDSFSMKFSPFHKFLFQGSHKYISVKILFILLVFNFLKFGFQFYHELWFGPLTLSLNNLVKHSHQTSLLYVTTRPLISV